MVLNFDGLFATPSTYDEQVEEREKAEADANLAILEGDLAIVDGNVLTVDGKVVGVANDVSVVDGKVVTAIADIGTVDDKVVTVDGKVVTNNTDIATLDGKVVTVDGKVVTVTSDVAIVDGKVVVVDTNVDVLTQEALRTKLIIKENDQDKTNTSLSNDNELTFTVVANSVYLINLLFSHFSASSSPDLKYTFIGPSASIGTFAETSNNDNISSTRRGVAFGTTEFVPIVGGETKWTGATGVVQTNANGGTVAFRWAQNTDAFTTTVNEGSWMTLTKL